jgi:hypothetical protein
LPWDCGLCAHPYINQDEVDWAFDTRVNRPLRYCYILAPEYVLHIPVHPSSNISSSIIFIYTLFYYYYYHHFCFYTFNGCIHQITSVNRPLRYCYILASESVLHISVDYYLSVHNSGKICLQHHHWYYIHTYMYTYIHTQDIPFSE